MSRLTQIEFDFEKEQKNEKPALPKILEIIQCFECKTLAEIDGYRFRLVPLCRPCRTQREVEITRNRFERRQTR